MTPATVRLERIPGRAGRIQRASQVSLVAAPDVLCHCSSERHGRMGPHIDWPLRLLRARLAGDVPDEKAFGQASR